MDSSSTPNTPSSTTKRSPRIARPTTSPSQYRKSASSLQNSRARTHTRPTTALSRTRQVRSLLDDAECVALRDSLLRGEADFADIDTEKMLRLLSHLREFTQVCALNEDYKTAKRARDLSNDVRGELTARGTYRRSIQEQKDATDAQIRDFEAKWREIKIGFSRDTDKRKEELTARQGHEQRRFERVWNEEMPHKYRKPSAQLLQLKQIEKSLAISGKIDEADAVHEHADALSRREMAAAQESLSADYEAAKCKLAQKQADEMRMFLELREHERQLMESKYGEERQKLNNRDLVVTTRCKKVTGKAILSDSVNSLPTNLPRDHGKPLGTLLPPLIPPNDPKYIEKKRKKKEEIARKQRNFQRKNAEQVLSQYSTQQIEQTSQRTPSVTSSSYSTSRSENVENGQLEGRAQELVCALIDGNNENQSQENQSQGEQQQSDGKQKNSEMERSILNEEERENEKLKSDNDKNNSNSSSRKENNDLIGSEKKESENGAEQ